MPNYGYHLARAEAQATRGLYARALPLLVRRKTNILREFPFEVFTYSSEAAVLEQVASIRSFLQHAGRPPRLTVVSDGSHTETSIALLRALDRSIVVERAAARLTSDFPEAFATYLREHPTGKQLAVVMSLPANGPALYLDSDVLFFPGAAAALVRELSAADANLYLADCQHSADDRLFRNADERARPVNTGVLFLRRKLEWSAAIDRFLALDGAPTFFTNQTLTHLAMHANGAQPLDSRKFVLQLDDQFVYADRYAGPDVILRHYVNPVRHKFWNAILRQSLHG